jgi:hypothetical protein
MGIKCFLKNKLKKKYLRHFLKEIAGFFWDYLF